MSRFFSEKYSNLEAYTPGEQPKDMQYTKLNTNESPFPPSQKALEYAAEAAKRLQLYCDPDCTALTKEFAKLYGIGTDEVLFTNGSDDALNFAFMAFCDREHPAAFPDITYGFYPVFADLNHVPYEEIPLRDDFTICVDDYCGINKTIFIANPNAPTGIALSLADIERIVQSNPDNVVIVDEAYVDFGADSAVGLIKKYDNLLVTQTFSKSRSLAGGRLGMAIGSAPLIRDLNTIKYSTNPYNINTMTQAAGTGTILDDDYSKKNCAAIAENRGYLTAELEKLGFVHTPSTANFVFAKHPHYDGEALYLELKKRGVLIRHFTKERIKDYNRITVGTKEQLDILLNNIKELLEETA
ncbi:MAG: histidinol-phosphate transaminase [Ruminococcus sp.]|uniref:histidinol-phosphate transaminase n=1 Tax=Ruminococcus sp. TaxID=41978 RepID=UPI002872DF6F|nr:histidinol-phosphate transaminase [Ruminococcus sp.]MBQ3284629.1 histidinol-phosphate transaminase [Ruminococcus sp.]